MKKFKSLRSEITEAKAKASDYNATSEKSKFGGHRANVVHKTKGDALYTGKVSFKTPKAAQSAADAYLTGYALGGEKSADKMMNAHIKNNKKNLVDPSVLDTMESVDEAATKVIASVELWNGKKMKKSFKNQSAAEAFIKKMQDEEDVRGYNMYAEGLDEAGPTYIDGVKYQKLKKMKGFNKADWEWNSSKQLYKRVNEAFDLDELHAEALVEGASDKIAKQMVVLNTKIDQIRGDIQSTEAAHRDNDIDNAKFKKLDNEHNKRLSKAEAELDKLFARFKSVKESIDLDEAFKRIPGNMINGELPRAAKDLESVLRGLKAGNDFDEKAFNKVLAALNNIKKSAKSFKSADDVTTPYQYRADPRYKNK